MYKHPDISITIYISYVDPIDQFSKAFNLLRDLEDEFGLNNFTFKSLGNGKYIISFKNEHDAVKAKLRFG